MSFSLVKGQKVSLKNGDGGAVTKIMLGLGWDVSPSAGDVDLDAPCATFDADKNVLEYVYFGNKDDSARSIHHKGDNLTGDGDGDDEQIIVDLLRVPAQVQSLVFTVTSFRGQKFEFIDNAFVRVIDVTSGAELCKYNLSDKRPYTAMIMAKAYRHNGEWKVAALGEAADGRTVKDLAGVMARAI